MRLTRLRKALEEKKLDGFLVCLPANRRYLSGYTPEDGQIGETSGMLLISDKGAFLLTDFRYELTAREEAPLFETVIYHDGLALELASLVDELGIKKLGFEPEGLLVGWHNNLAEHLHEVELVPTGRMVAGLRARKDKAEVAAVQKSLDIMREVLDKVLRQDLVGRTEREVALALIRGVEDAGAQGMAFPPMVASGPNGAEPHAEPGSRVIGRGEPVVVDVGARLDGYCSDITRTVVAGGLTEADGTFREIYPIVRRAQLAALGEIVPGMTGAEADQIARDIIAGAGYGPRFGHSLGHGVGLATHESPSVSPNSETVLEPGMIITVEPGIYLPGWGGVRLEHMALVTETGLRLLDGPEWMFEL